MAIFSLLWCTLWIVALIVLLLLVQHRKITLELYQYRQLRNNLSIVIAAYAAFTIFRVAERAYSQQPVQSHFRLELIGYTIFWVLFPAIWFFLEYCAIESGAIKLPENVDREPVLKRTKEYADYASKIWAAILAVLAVFASMFAKSTN